MVIKMNSKSPKFNVLQFPSIFYTLFVNTLDDVKKISKNQEIKRKQVQILKVLYNTFNNHVYKALEKEYLNDPNSKFEFLFDNVWVRKLNKYIIKEIKDKLSMMNNKDDDWFMWVDSVNIVNMNNFIDAEDNYYKENINDPDFDKEEEDFSDYEMEFIYQENLNLGFHDPEYFEKRLMHTTLEFIDQFDESKDIYCSKYNNEIIGFLSQLTVCIMSNKEPSCICFIDIEDLE